MLLEEQGKLEEAGLRSLGLGARRDCGSVEGKAVLEWPGQGTGEFLVSKFHRKFKKSVYEKCDFACGTRLGKFTLKCNVRQHCRRRIWWNDPTRRGPSKQDVPGSQTHETVSPESRLRLYIIRLTGLLHLNSSTCISCKGRSTLSSKKWDLVARFYLELWLMHRSCVPASRSTRKAFTLASWFPPSHPMQIRFAGFGVWRINVPHCITNNTLPHTSCGSQHKAHLAHTGTRGIHGHTGTQAHGHTRNPRAHGHTRNPRAHEASTGTRQSHEAHEASTGTRAIHGHTGAGIKETQVTWRKNNNIAAE